MMQLESFQLFNFRSINDSGLVELSRITALLGRNESGKSNLLLGLRTLNPVEGFSALNRTKDFPRHRRRSECTLETKVLWSLWRLTAAEQIDLGAIWWRAEKTELVEIERSYGTDRFVRFQRLLPLTLDPVEVKAAVAIVVGGVKAAASDLESDQAAVVATAVQRFEQSVAEDGELKKWAENIDAGARALADALKGVKCNLDDKSSVEFSKLQLLSKRVVEDDQSSQKARDWILGRLPVFIYLDEYPELDGYQNITEYLNRKARNQLVDSDVNFEKLCKVAGLSPGELQSLLGEGKHEERNQIANRASAVVTKELNRLWKDRKLKVRFNPDAEHFETLVSDPTSAFDVEVNLDERSRGFRWFFSFYITFSADTDGGRASNSIILLDEPGLFLHIESQKDLQRHFEADFDNQILYTTHSPFMIPIQALDTLKTVNISEELGTTVTNNPTGDGRTLAPIRAALGYYYSDGLFIGPNNLVIEGVTDWWILDAVSKHFVGAGKAGLPTNLSLPPVDGAPKVPGMVSLLTAQRLNVLVLLDDEKQGREVRDQMLKAKFVREHQVIMVSEAFGGEKPSEADIEDLIDPEVYEQISLHAYERELEGKNLSLDKNIPRIVKRFERAFKDVGLTFNKTRVDGLFARRMGVEPTKLMSADSAARFELLFSLISERLKEVINRAAEPFQ